MQLNLPIALVLLDVLFTGLCRLEGNMTNVSRQLIYEAYLKSFEWHVKRDKALKRDNYICQGCLNKKAEVVRDKTYDHLGNELLFELVSLCRPCHKIAHGPAALDFRYDDFDKF